MPLPCEQPYGQGSENQQQGQAAQTEQLSHEQMPGPDSEPACGIAYIVCGKFLPVCRKQAHVLLPAEKVGDCRNENEDRKYRDTDSGDPYGRFPLLLVPAVPDPHFFLPILWIFFWRRFLPAACPMLIPSPGREKLASLAILPSTSPSGTLSL